MREAQERMTMSPKERIDGLVPSEKRKLTHTIVHEAGHAAKAILLGLRVSGYVIGDYGWGDQGAYKKPKGVVDGKVILNQAIGETDWERKLKMSAASGAAAELVYFGYINSTAGQQKVDRLTGNFRSYREIDEMANKIADELEASEIFYECIRRMARGEALDDLSVKT
ncbi:hypothetical protein HYU91_04645 [Candidatus Collierbacteria bacterium]|nr:hypothetical protein [Candidatus Collierbacteria bacterium]